RIYLISERADPNSIRVQDFTDLGNARAVNIPQVRGVGRVSAIRPNREVILAVRSNGRLSGRARDAADAEGIRIQQCSSAADARAVNAEAITEVGRIAIVRPNDQIIGSRG